MCSGSAEGLYLRLIDLCRHTFRGTNIEREAAGDWIYDLDLGLQSGGGCRGFLYLWEYEGFAMDNDRHTFRVTNIEREAAEDWIHDLDLP